MKNKKALIFLVLVLFFMNIFSLNVSADSVYSLDYGWESEIIGSTDGTSGLIEYDSVETDVDSYFRISTTQYRETRSLEIDTTESTDEVLGYWNISTDFNYISNFSFWVYAIDGGSDGYINMTFRNDTGDVIVLKFDNDGSLDYKASDDSFNLLFTPFGAGLWLYVLIDHNDTNVMRYRVYNDTMVLKSDITGTSNFVGDWTTFNNIIFEGYNTPSLSLYFDDFNITTNSGENEYERCLGNGFTVEKRFDDSNIGYNQTASFKIWYDGDIDDVGYWYAHIVNGNGAIVDTIGYNNQNPMYYDLFVLPEYLTGTYYFKLASQYSTGYDIICPFTVTQGSASGDWYIGTDKLRYDLWEFPTMIYKIPSGSNGSVYYKYAGGDWDILLENIPGNGDFQERTMFPETSPVCIQLKLVDTETLLGYHSKIFCFVGPDDLDYIIKIDSVIAKSIYVNDEIDCYIKYTGNSYDNPLYLRFYNNTDPSVNDIFYKSISLGSYNSLVSYNTILWNINNSVGNETFYMFLTSIDIIYKDQYCTLIVYDSIEEDVTFLGDDWYGLPYWVPYVLGIFITLIVTISPLLLATYITRKTRIDRVSIPSLLYVGFFFFGLIISVVMNLLPAYLPFVILFGMIIYFAIQWLFGQKGVAEGE